MNLANLQLVYSMGEPQLAQNLPKPTTGDPHEVQKREAGVAGGDGGETIAGGGCGATCCWYAC